MAILTLRSGSDRGRRQRGATAKKYLLLVLRLTFKTVNYYASRVFSQIQKRQFLNVQVPLEYDRKTRLDVLNCNI